MIVAGAKGFAKELLEVLYRDYKFTDISFYDDVSSDLPGYLYKKFEVIKNKQKLIERLKENNIFSLGVGTPLARYKLYQMFTSINGKVLSIISNRTSIGSFNTTIGDGCTIMDGVKITNDVTIGNCCLINLNSTIGHDCIIGKFCDISPGVNVSGHGKIGNYCTIGTGAVLIPGVKLGNNVVVGAGTVVTKDIPDDSLVVGVPGKVIKNLNEFKGPWIM